ncbi:MAG: hypothetical protein OXG65_12065 [Chloroflexi bacterium]|nr:hypothetical protein [Chloroflexota bacterium]
MTLDPSVIPGLLLLAAALLGLAAVGYVVARVALRQSHDGLALAQGLVIGPALWGLIVNFVLHALPGMAGAAAAWAITLALAAGLAWQRPAALRAPPRMVVGFAAAVLALFWVVLASRQLMSIVDAYLHLGLAASIRAGGYPPAFPWQPGVPAPYHYGADLLTSLLAPPVGPDAAFTTEVIDAYAWTGLALIVVTTVLRFGSRLTALAICPLLLSFGLWTQLHYTTPPGILQLPVPAGLPAAGLRAALTEVYWPAVNDAWTAAVEMSPANVWKPHFVLAYALAFVALERVTAGSGRGWLAQTTLALLLAFLGLVDETIAPIVLVLWAGLEVLEVARSGHLRSLLASRGGGDAARAVPWAPILRAAAGPALAALLLAVAGGAITGALTSSARSGLTLGWIADAGSRRPVGEFSSWPGGVGLLELGTLPVGAAALLLAWRQRLVLALTAAAGLLLLAAFSLRYEYSLDLVRLDGHARNFALLGLLVALAARLAAMPPRGRYAASALLVGLVTWPTAVAPVHNVGLALTRGPQLANAQPAPLRYPADLIGRYAMPKPMSPVVAEYIRLHTPVDARILSPVPTEMSIVTGRPNASAYAEFVQFVPVYGPEYLDAIQHLEPLAVHRLGATYVHASDAWVAGLPEQARRWLDSPEQFRPLVRDGEDTLYGIQPAFLELDTTPPPRSFEALRQAVPASTTVYLSPALEPVNSIRAAVVLSHTRLLGRARPTPTWHSRPDFASEPLGDQTPDLVVTSALLAPSAFPVNQREPIWWNEEIAVYAPSGAIDRIVTPPARDFSVAVSDVEAAQGQISFTATFNDRAPGLWRGQDWLTVAVDASPWAIPSEFEADERRHAGVQWYGGQVVPGRGTTMLRVQFDPRDVSLSVQNEDGSVAQTMASGGGLEPGVWVLAVRLRGEWWEVAFIPLIKVSVSQTGDISYQVYEGTLGAALMP